MLRVYDGAIFDFINHRVMPNVWVFLPFFYDKLASRGRDCISILLLDNDKLSR
jgi:hypothetical protein